MKEGLTGPLVLAFSQEDPGSAARVVKDFAKDNDKLVVKAGRHRRQLLDPSELERLAKMPTRDEALAMLMGVMQAPVDQARPHPGRAVPASWCARWRRFATRSRRPEADRTPLAAVNRL